MLLPTESPSRDRIDDQARELRRMIAIRSRSRASVKQPTRRCRSMTVFSGKGGVGKSVLALNLAVALAKRGESVCLVDASSHVGNVGLMCGQNGYWNLSHVFAGTRNLDHVLLSGPAGVTIVPGAAELLRHPRAGSISSIMKGLAEFESRYDWLIVDTASDALRQVRPFITAADCALAVTTPDPTAVAEVYAGMKSLAATNTSPVSVIVNQSDSELQAREILLRLRQATRVFLGGDIATAGQVPFDDAVRRAVACREPLSAIDPGCPAQRALEQIAERLSGTISPNREFGYFERLEASAVRS